MFSSSLSSSPSSQLTSSHLHDQFRLTQIQTLFEYWWEAWTNRWQIRHLTLKVCTLWKQLKSDMLISTGHLYKRVMLKGKLPKGVGGINVKLFQCNWLTNYFLQSVCRSVSLFLFWNLWPLKSPPPFPPKKDAHKNKNKKITMTMLIQKRKTLIGRIWTKIRQIERRGTYTDLPRGERMPTSVPCFILSVETTMTCYTQKLV